MQTADEDYRKESVIDMNEDELYKRYEIILKYKRSILLDQFLFFIPGAIILFTSRAIDDAIHGYGDLFFFGLMIVMFGFYFTSDKIFRNQSIGKMLYGIQVSSNAQNTRVTWFAVANRRFLEVWIHPMLGYTFLEKSNMIDKATKTYITENNRVKHKTTH